MYRRVLALCLSLWCTGLSMGLQCNSTRSSAMKFTIRSYRNQTGHWVAQVLVDHNADHKDAGPWEVDVDHSTVKCGDSESVTIATTITAPASKLMSSLPAGYELLPGLGYYKLRVDVKTWHEALDACKQEGTHLLIINSENECKALNYLWQKHPKIPGAVTESWAWIGLHDQYKEGEYVTIFNDPLSTTGFAKWSTSEPHGLNQDCGLVGRNFLLADFPCLNKQPFFCEREI